MVEPIVSPGRPLFGEKKSVRGKSVAIAEIRTNSVKHTWRKLGCYAEINSRTFRNLEVVIYNTSVVLREGVKLAGKL